MLKKEDTICSTRKKRRKRCYILHCNEINEVKRRRIHMLPYVPTKQEQPQRQDSYDRRTSGGLTQAMRYNNVLSAWLESIRMQVKESTWARYTHLIDRHIRPQLGEYRINQIDTHTVEQFIAQKLHCGRLDQRGPLSPKTVTDILMVLKRTMDYARRSNIDVICELDGLRVKKRERKMRVLDQAEQEALIGILLQETDLNKFGVLLALYTGIRIGELCALRWENFDLDAAILKIRHTLQRVQNPAAQAATKTKILITEPKSACSVRNIPLPECIVKIARQFCAEPEAFVLTGSCEKYVEPRTMQNRFKGYLKQGSINDANFHALRHTFATRCIEIGFDLKSLSEILGHTTVNITLNRYVHASYALKRKNMNRLLLPGAAIGTTA